MSVVVKTSSNEIELENVTSSCREIVGQPQTYDRVFQSGIISGIEGDTYTITIKSPIAFRIEKLTLVDTWTTPGAGTAVAGYSIDRATCTFGWPILSVLFTADRIPWDFTAELEFKIVFLKVCSFSMVALGKLAL